MQHFFPKQFLPQQLLTPERVCLLWLFDIFSFIFFFDLSNDAPYTIHNLLFCVFFEEWEIFLDFFVVYSDCHLLSFFSTAVLKLWVLPIICVFFLVIFVSEVAQGLFVHVNIIFYCFFLWKLNKNWAGVPTPAFIRLNNFFLYTYFHFRFFLLFYSDNIIFFIVVGGSINHALYSRLESDLFCWLAFNLWKSVEYLYFRRDFDIFSRLSHVWFICICQKNEAQDVGTG